MVLEDLLRHVSVALHARVQAERVLSRELAPDFRLYEYFRSDEYALSRILADLVDVRGKHGQRALFLKSFLSLIDAPEWALPESLESVTQEYRTPQGRRLDLFLRFSDGSIGIENKPWAADGENQLQDYAIALSEVEQQRGKDHWYLVYLSNTDPGEHSISQERLESYLGERKFKHLGFDAVESWLSDCALRIRPANLKVFLEGVVLWVRERVNGRLDMSDTNEIKDVLFQSEHQLEAGLAIAGAWREIAMQLMHTLKEALEERNHEQELTVNWVEREAVKEEAGFDFILADQSDVRVGFRFEYAGFHHFYFGLMAHQNPDEERRKQLHEAISQEFGMTGEVTPWWIWWMSAKRYPMLGERYDSWSSSHHPWWRIQTEADALASEFFEIAGRIAGAVRRI
jgi:hypothetical protein